MQERVIFPSASKVGARDGGRRISAFMRCLLLGMLALASLMPVSVAAHTSLLQTTPAPNSTLDHTPDLITLQFDQPLQPGYQQMTVFDATQRPVTSSIESRLRYRPVGADHRRCRNWSTGVYSVLWQVLSPDGHPVRGAYVFTVACPATRRPRRSRACRRSTASPPRIALPSSRCAAGSALWRDRCAGRRDRYLPRHHPSRPQDAAGEGGSIASAGCSISGCNAGSLLPSASLSARISSR